MPRGEGTAAVSDALPTSRTHRTQNAPDKPRRQAGKRYMNVLMIPLTQVVTCTRWVGLGARRGRWNGPLGHDASGPRWHSNVGATAPPSERPFPRSWESGGVGATNTRASQVKFDFAKARTDSRALACAFLRLSHPPFRPLSPQRLPPPPDTGSAAALPPSVAGSLLGQTEPFPIQ